MALQTSQDTPAPVRQVAMALSGWINRLGWIWVEGQITQLNLRPGMVFLTLRDTDAEISVPITCHRNVLDAVVPPVTEGARVIVHAKPRYYEPRGSLSLTVDSIRPVGIGELLARIEQRRRILAAEGLFESIRKRPLPFLPRRVGLVTGRASAAERDVLKVAAHRWPGVEFEVINTLVQGPSAAAEVIKAVGTLDDHATVDVIIIARGGGSVEDLLPFSDEGLIRAVSACATPVVSAIGHEPDSPILDLVADVRASTPTDAAKRVVPDVAEELAGLAGLRERSRLAIEGRLHREVVGLANVRSRPAFAAPMSLVDDRRSHVDDLRTRACRSLQHRLDRAHDEIGHHLARVRGLSPLSTLQRGYAVAQSADGSVITSIAQVAPDDELQVRLTDGHLVVRTLSTEPAEEALPIEETKPS